MRMPPVQVSYFPLEGGLNQVTAPLVMPPGRALSAVNFDVDVDGGYRRIAGYECFDGAAEPDAVPGSGSILGVHIYDGEVYAFRNATDGLSAKMYKATASGWDEIVTGVTLAPGGKYFFINHNFAGSSATMMMYGCDGANKAFSFDGTTFTQISTGMSVDTPHLIAAHKNHLFLAFDTSVQHSSIGDPTTWTPVTGAGELALGDTVTAMVSQSGDASGGALVLATRNTLNVLYGTSSADWSLVLAQQSVGCILGTAQNVAGKLMALDDRGMMELSRSISFGNFDNAVVGREVTPFINENRPSVVASSVSRNDNQYRLHFSNGYSLYVTVFNGEVTGSMPIYFPDPVTAICSSEWTDGTERILFGSTNGKVYEIGGTSFDGTAISAHLYLAFNHIKSPRDRKFYRKMILDMRGVSVSSFDVGYKFNYDSTEVDPGVVMTASGAFDPVYWDSFTWDSFTWDGASGMPIEVGMAGTGYNCSIHVDSNSSTSERFTISGVTIQYTPRRRER